MSDASVPGSGKSPAAEIECYGCRTPQPANAMQCATCGATFRGLCVCGAEVSKLDETCAKCGAPVTRGVPERGKLIRKRRLGKVAVVAAAVASAVGAVLVRNHLNAQPWQLYETGRRKFVAGDFAGAANEFERLTSESPNDAQAWYMLAAAYRSLGMGPDTYLAAARHALDRLPTHVETLSLLANAEYEAGRLDAAAAYARTAAAQPNARAADFELLVRIEMLRPSPDAGSLRQLLADARSRGLQSAFLSVVQADVSLRACEGLPRDMFPAGVVDQFREALAAIEDPKTARTDATASAAISARILTALGEDERAAAILDRALAALPAGAPADARAELLALHGWLLRQAGSLELGDAALVEALRSSPDARLASSIAARFAATGRTEEVAGILAQAADADPNGALHAALAQVLLARGRLDDADAALTAARRARPDAAAFLVLEGDIRAAQGRADDAIAAYTKAAQTAPDAVDAPVRLALLRVRTAADETARRDAAEVALRDLSALEARAGRRPEISIAVAAMRLERGDAAAARTELEFVTANAPALLEGWVLLGRACALGGDADAAALAFRQGRRLQPDSTRLAVAEGTARLTAGDASGAQAACTAFLSEHAGDIAVLRVRAQAARALGRWDAAADDLRRVRAAAPDDETVLVLLAECEYRAGRRDAAGALVAASLASARPETAARLELIRAVHEEGAGAAIALVAARGPSTLLAEMQFRAGRADDAIATARALLAADPRNHAAARIQVMALVDRKGPLPERVAAARAALDSVPADAPAGTRDLLLGRILLAEGDARAAAEHLSAAASALPSDPDSRVCHGEALFRAGERDAGLAELRAAAALPGASAWCGKILSSRLASAARDASQPRTAEALAREALGVDATNAAAAELLAGVLERRGEFRAAAELAERILTGPGLDADAAQRMRRCAAVARVCAGDTTQAFEHIAALEKSGEAPVVAAEFRGVAHLRAGHLDDAAKEFASALEGETATRVAAIGLAETALRRGDREGAAAAVARWRAKHPDDRDVGLAVSRMLVAQGGLDEASALLADVVAAHPADRAAAAARIEVLARLGRPAEAVTEARRYETAAPAADRPRARLLVAETLVNDGGAPAEGLDIAREVASAAGVPDDLLHEAWAVEAEALLGLGRTAAAETSLARITRSWRDDSPVPSQDGAIERRVRFVRGVLAAGAGRLPDASAEFRRCIAIDPLDLASQNNLAWVLLKSPDTVAQAVALARRITTLAPSNADYWDTRGQAARAAGDVADAETSWVRALELMRAAAPKDGAAFGATGMRLANLYRDSRREDAAKKLAREVGERAKGTPHADAARAFLGE